MRIAQLSLPIACHQGDGQESDNQGKSTRDNTSCQPGIRTKSDREQESLCGQAESRDLPEQVVPLQSTGSHSLINELT